MEIFFFIGLFAVTGYLGWGCERMRKGINNHRRDQEAVSACTERPDRRQVKLWRWVFVCCETFLITILSISGIQSSRGYKYLDFFSHPIRASIIAVVDVGAILFLLTTSPFLVRRLGLLAIGGWITAIISLVWLALPAF